MNKNTFFLAYIIQRLEEWAAWYDTGNGHQVGYATCSLEYRLMNEGTIAKRTGHRPVPCHKDAEEVEAWVRDLALHVPEIAIALRYHYFSAEASHKQIKNVKFSRSKMDQYVAMGHQWLTRQVHDARKKKETGICLVTARKSLVNSQTVQSKRYVITKK